VALPEPGAEVPGPRTAEAAVSGDTDVCPPVMTSSGQQEMILGNRRVELDAGA
jgi:hypothetical protein